MDDSDTSRELKEYLEKHRVHELFTKIVEELLKTRPESPLQAIADYLASEYDVRAAVRRESGSRPTEVIEAYHNETEDEDDDDDDDGDAEDTDEAGEMVAIPAPTRPAGRRTSVSAGVMNLERAKAHVAPVFDKSDEEKARILKCISSNPLFSECDNAALETLTAAFEKCSFPPGQVIIRQGDLVAEHFFLLDSGTASALIGEQEVKTYNDGDSFGELALLYNQPRAATVKATSDAALWRLDQNTFKSIIVANVLEKRAKYIEFLKRCQLMQALSELEIMTLADSLEPRTFSKGQEIIVQGEVGNDFYVIEDGEVQCVKDGEPVLKLSSGDYFGELALLYNQARQASVVVESDGASVLVIDRKTFQRLMGPLGAILKRNPLHAQYIELASE